MPFLYFGPTSCKGALDPSSPRYGPASNRPVDTALKGSQRPLADDMKLGNLNIHSQRCPACSLRQNALTYRVGQGHLGQTRLPPGQYSSRSLRSVQRGQLVVNMVSAVGEKTVET